MAIQGDPEQLLMQEAWARLWKPGTKYYLPDVIVNGAQGNGIVVDPLGRLVVPDTGSIPLFENSVLGSVAVDLSNGTLGGLDTLGNGGMQYDTATGSFSATVTVGELSFDGDYAVITGGVAGCAIDSAASILKVFRAEGDVAGEVEGDDADLELARAYRERLLGTKNGPDLVVTYYDHNEAMDEIVSNDAVFQTAWRTHETEGKTTADFAKQTSTAAERPEDPQATVGDEAYEKHSAYMSTLLLNRALWMKKQHGDPDGRWLSLAEAIADAKGQAQQAPSGPKTVDQVIQLVESPPTERVEAAADPLWEEAERQVEEDLPRWEEEARAAEAEEGGEAAGPGSSIAGRFTDTVANASVAITGTIAVVGTPPNLSLEVTLTKLEADVPSIAVHLEGESKLLAEVQNAIANSHWFQQILTKKVAEQLGAKSVREYLGARVNQAISQALGPA